MKKVTTKILYFFIFLSFACTNDPDCDNSEFHNGISINATIANADDVLFDSIEYLTSGFRVADITTSQFDIWVNPDAGTSTFVFHDQHDIDTLSVSYTKTPEVVSTDCGAILRYADLVIIRSTFDSAVLISKTLSRRIDTNIEIYD